MAWQKVERQAPKTPTHERRTKACVSRSPKRPDAAYMMLPRDMVWADRVSIYHDGGSRIAFEFSQYGEYAVRPTSKTSFTMKVTIPKPLAHLIPFGLQDVDLASNEDDWMVLDVQTLA